MPVIRYIPTDPTDLVIQGSLLTENVLKQPVAQSPVISQPVSSADSFNPPILNENTPEMWWPDPPVVNASLKSQDQVPMNNATISTQCGALIDVMLTGRPRFGVITMSTTLWVVEGTTLDADDAPLPGCRVVVLETGRLVVGESPVVADVLSSDVDGTFSIPLSGNSDHMIIAYLPGSPDRAGITLHPLIPTSNG